MKKAIILLSGGLDSATCLAIAKSNGYSCYTLSLDYGQKHRAELNSATALSLEYAARHEIMKVNFGKFGGSALTDANIKVADFKEIPEIPEIPDTYVPARNTIMLSLALGWAEILKAQDIFIGISQVDYSGYPDCREEYLLAFQNMANLATKTGVEGNPITIHAPLINLSKSQTISLGVSLGVDYSKTISCYRADDVGRACGTCESCHLRKKGFLEAGISDPTNYQD